MTKNYSIDKDGIIHYYPVDGVGFEETIAVSELLEMALYFRSREFDIRHMVNKEYPREMERPLMLVGDCYIGTTKEGAKVTVAKSDFDRVMEQAEHVIRSDWLFDIKDKRKGYRSGPEFVILDEQGRETLPKDAYGNPIPPKPELTEASCPIEIVQEGLAKRRTVDFWNLREENKTRGEWQKVR